MLTGNSSISRRVCASASIKKRLGSHIVSAAAAAVSDVHNWQLPLLKPTLVNWFWKTPIQSLHDALLFDGQATNHVIQKKLGWRATRLPSMIYSGDCREYPNCPAPSATNQQDWVALQSNAPGSCGGWKQNYPENLNGRKVFKMTVCSLGATCPHRLKKHRKKNRHKGRGGEAEFSSNSRHIAEVGSQVASRNSELDAAAAELEPTGNLPGLQRMPLASCWNRVKVEVLIFTMYKRHILYTRHMRACRVQHSVSYCFRVCFARGRSINQAWRWTEISSR